MKTELVLSRKENVLCNSLVVADKFNKQHKDVLKKIDNLKENLTAQKLPMESFMFIEKEHLRRGRAFRYIEMNRPAFSLLVMKFTGKKALEWQTKFNHAFYQMEQTLLRKSNLEWKNTREQGKQIRIGLTDEIKVFIDYAVFQGSKNASKYYILITKMQYKALGLIEKNEKISKAFRNTLDMMDLNHLLAAENVARKALLEGMEQKLHYKDIFQLAKTNVMQLADIMVIKLVTK